MNKDEKENRTEKKIHELDQYIEDVRTRVKIYKFVVKLSIEEFWKLDKELEDQNRTDDGNFKELMELNLPVDDIKRVKLFEKILNNIKTSTKYQKSESVMVGICEKAGLSNETVQELLAEKADIPDLMKYKEKLLNEDNPSVIENLSSKSCLSDGYVMTRIPRGTCIIINNTFHYDEGWDRKGTNFDKDRLKRLFEWLNFEVDVRNDMKAYEIYELFKNLDDNILDDSDCFVCCILTHGRASSIYGNDKKTVATKLLSKSVGADSCKKLANKPKLFIIQACRKESDPGVVEDFLPADMADGKRASQADIYMFVATTKGDYHYREKNLGSFYIQTLCEVFEKYAAEASLMEMLTKINQQLRYNKIRLDDRNYQVLDSTMMTLCQPLYFRPQKKFKDFCRIANIVD